MAAAVAASVVGDVLNMDGVVRLVVVSMGNDLISGLRLLALQAVSNEEDGGEDQGDLGGGEGLEGDELDDEQFAEQQLSSQQTDDTAHTASLLFATTCEQNKLINHHAKIIISVFFQTNDLIKKLIQLKPQCLHLNLQQSVTNYKLVKFFLDSIIIAFVSSH